MALAQEAPPSLDGAARMSMQRIAAGFAFLPPFAGCLSPGNGRIATA
jgi:hypothetical protein